MMMDILLLKNYLRVPVAKTVPSPNTGSGSQDLPDAHDHSGQDLASRSKPHP